MVKAGLDILEQRNTPGTHTHTNSGQLFEEKRKEFWCRALRELQKGLKEETKKVD